MEWSLNFLLCLLSLKQRERARERVRKSPCRLLKIACLGIPVWTLVLLGSQNIRLNFKRKVGTPVSSQSPLQGRLVAGSPMAELHIVGSLVGAKDFEESSLFCKWQLITDDGRPDNKR